MNTWLKTSWIDSNNNRAYSIAEIQKSTALHPRLRGNEIKTHIEIELVLGICAEINN